MSREWKDKGRHKLHEHDEAPRSRGTSPPVADRARQCAGTRHAAGGRGQATHRGGTADVPELGRDDQVPQSGRPWTVRDPPTDEGRVRQHTARPFRSRSLGCRGTAGRRGWSGVSEYALAVTDGTVSCHRECGTGSRAGPAGGTAHGAAAEVIRQTVAKWRCARRRAESRPYSGP